MEMVVHRISDGIAVEIRRLTLADGLATGTRPAPRLPALDFARK